MRDYTCNFWESILSFHCGFLGSNSGHQAYTARALIPWAISPAHSPYFKSTCSVMWWILVYTDWTILPWATSRIFYCPKKKSMPRHWKVGYENDAPRMPPSFDVIAVCQVTFPDQFCKLCTPCPDWSLCSADQGKLDFLRLLKSQVLCLFQRLAYWATLGMPQNFITSCVCPRWARGEASQSGLSTRTQFCTCAWTSRSPDIHWSFSKLPVNISFPSSSF